MCGISGFFNKNSNKIDENLLHQLSEALQHRGPDHHGKYYSDYVGLAHNRLSILDLSKNGNQPFSNDRYHLVYNGEIYNYIDMRHDLKEFKIAFRSNSDTEVLFHYLIHFGVQRTLQELNGMFAFAFFDQKKKKLYLCRDRLGIKPLFFTLRNDTLFFASEIKALVKNLDFKVDNVKALYSTLGANEKSRHETVFEDLFHVMPGSYLEYDADGLKKTTYFDLVDLINENSYNFRKSKSFSHSVLEFKELFSSSVKKMLMSDASMGAFVSGGIDSSLIAMEASKVVENNFQLFTANIIGQFSEYDDARKLAQELDLELKDYRFNPEYFLRDLAVATWYYETPIVTHANGVPFANVSRLANENNVKAVLTGEGADELFMGYPRLLTQKFDGLIRSPFNVLNALYSSIPPLKSYISGGGSAGMEILFDKASQNFSRDLIRKKALDKLGFLRESEKKNHYQTIQMINEGLVSLLWRNDRMGMMYSIESRFPFLDEKILEFAINLPIKYKFGLSPRLHNYKHPFLLDKKIIRFLAKGKLTKNLLYKKKNGFPCYGLGNMDIQTEFFKDGYVSHLLKLNNHAQTQFFSENFDKYHIAKFAALEIWGSLFVLKKSIDNVEDKIARSIKMVF